jgi:hypothetical protein
LLLHLNKETRITMRRTKTTHPVPKKIKPFDVVL